MISSDTETTKNTLLTYKEYKSPYMWMLLSSVILAITMPALVVVYIAIVLAIGFSFIPFTLLLGVPIIIVFLAFLGVLILTKLLTRVYRLLNIWDPSILAFVVVSTYLIFYYGFFSILTGRDTLSGYSEGLQPTYFGVNAYHVSIVLFLFCIFSPVLYEWLSNNLGKKRWTIVFIPMTFAAINIWQLGL